MIASLGAVMDVAVSLLSALWELHVTQPTLSGTALFTSGMHIGRDMIGTMSNTLVFAFAGDSTITSFAMVLFSYIINSQPDGGSKTQRNAKGSLIRGAGERQRD